MVLTYLIHSSTMLNTYDIHNKVISAHSRTIQNNQNHISISAKKESITKCTPHWVVSYFDNHNPIKLMPCPSARTKLFLSRTKWKLSWTKSFLSEAKKSFFIQSSLMMNFLSMYKIFCSGQKIFWLRQFWFCQGQKSFCLDRWIGHKYVIFAIL